jgi:hypothetical protein
VESTPRKGRNIDPGSVPFGEIAKFKADFFGKEVTLKAAVQRGQAKKRRAKQRILWPIVMLCGCESVNDAKHDHIDGSLNLASCHFVLWSWYLAVIEALQADETWSTWSPRMFSPSVFATMAVPTLHIASQSLV